MRNLSRFYGRTSCGTTSKVLRWQISATTAKHNSDFQNTMKANRNGRLLAIFTVEGRVQRCFDLPYEH